MKSLDLKYGSGKVKISIPDENITGVLSGKHMAPLENPAEEILKAFENPAGSKPLSKIVKKRETVAIVVSDYTRSTSADIFLPVLINKLNDLEIPDKDIFIVFGNGTHIPQTPEQQRKIVGEEIASRIKFFDHDCRDELMLVDLGRTSRGTPVKINKRVFDADKKIITGSITYHYFAGFGGGRKGILPGIAGFETIQANHKLSMQPESTTAALDNNPVSLDMEEGAKLLKPDFLINTVLNENKEFCGIFAGDMIKAHREGCKFINDYAKVKIDKKADLVIAAAGGGGMDVNYVQSHKGMENAHFALKDGGVMILLAESSQGFPSDAYLKYIKLGSGDKIHKELDRNFTIPGHTVFATFYKAEKFKIIWVSKLPEDIVKTMRITPADSFEEAFTMAKKWLGDKYSAYIMPTAYATFPVIK
ncbi:MAG: nickel-dependent lactate racemase [Candidatus Margulisiibacteriota bacterium]|nr:nickel-dependent lactate racemase [Candidatus Margulisiibacteriota bacterium]